MPESIDKREVLRNITFGRRVAEEEIDALQSYFVETDQWRRILSGDIDVVYGPKGSGKSAIYFLLLARQDELFDRRILLAAAENPRGTPAFKDLVEDPPTSEPEFRALWKLYLLSVVGKQLRDYRINNSAAARLIEKLEEAALLADEGGLSAMIKAALGYARSLLNVASIEGGVNLDPNTGMPVGFVGKITLAEPTQQQRQAGYISADELFGLADEALAGAGLHLWLVLDRLDVAFAESPELEQNALRAPFRVYVDNLGLSSVVLKIFLRDDLWRRITTGGFREASHITRSVTITWDETALLNLIIRRALQNDLLREYYHVKEDRILAAIDAQSELFYRMFPRQVEPGPAKPNTFNWLLGRTRDGTRRSAPRELIHLLESVRAEQVKSLEMGVQAPAGEALFTTAALKAGLPEVSRVRLEQTLYAEHPELKSKIEALVRQKTEQTISSLAAIWRVEDDEARDVAMKLVEIGFFEPRAERSTYWVPFLYRDALSMIQGAAG